MRRRTKEINSFRVKEINRAIYKWRSW